MVHHPETEGDVERLIFDRYGLTLLPWISDIAASLRGRSGTLPVNAASIASDVGASVRHVDDAASFGSTEYLSQGRFEIRLGTDLTPEQANFTIAHEVGHVMLHRASDGSLVSGEVVEDICDTFASYLLCPLQFVDGYLVDHGLSLKTVAQLSSTLQVPEEALAHLIADFYPATYCWGTLGHMRCRGPFDASSFRREIGDLHNESSSGVLVRRRISKPFLGLREWFIEVGGAGGDGFRALLKPVGPDVRDTPIVRSVNIPRNQVLQAERGSWAIPD